MVAEGRHADLKFASLLKPVKTGLDHLDRHRLPGGRPLRGNNHVVAIKPQDPVRPTCDSRDLLSCERTEKKASIRISLHACQCPARVRQSGSRIVMPLSLRKVQQQCATTAPTSSDRSRPAKASDLRQRPSATHMLLVHTEVVTA